MATGKLYLGNDWDVHRTNVASRGILQTGLTVRGFLSATPDGDPIHTSLDIAALDELNPGDYIGTLQGDDLMAQLGPLLDAAPNGKLIVYERVVVGAEDYSDVNPLQVFRDRPVSEAEAV